MRFLKEFPIFTYISYTSGITDSLSGRFGVGSPCISYTKNSLVIFMRNIIHYIWTTIFILKMVIFLKKMTAFKTKRGHVF